jgi:hypothetical protein
VFDGLEAREEEEEEEKKKKNEKTRRRDVKNNFLRKAVFTSKLMRESRERALIVFSFSFIIRRNFVLH